MNSLTGSKYAKVAGVLFLALRPLPGTACHLCSTRTSTMLLPVATTKEAVEAVQQQIHQQRKVIDRCKGENHALREELTLRTKVLVQSTQNLYRICSK